MTFYKSIIKESWLALIRNKYLWFFGLFAVLLGNGGEYEIFFRSIMKNEEGDPVWQGMGDQIKLVLSSFSKIGQRFMENPFDTSIILFFYILIIAIVLFVIWMINVSQAAIVDSIARQAREKEHSLKICLVKGIRFFWPVFTLNFFSKVLIVIGLALIGKANNLAIDSILFVVLIPLLMSLSFIVKYAIAYLIIRKERLADSLKSGFILFKQNWLISLELGLMLFVLTFGAGLFFMFLLFNITKFFEVITTAFPVSAFYVFTIIYPVTIFAVLAFIGALLSVFQINAWTKLFLELDSKGAISKIERIFSRS